MPTHASQPSPQAIRVAGARPRLKSVACDGLRIVRARLKRGHAARIVTQRAAQGNIAQVRRVCVERLTKALVIALVAVARRWCRRQAPKGSARRHGRSHGCTARAPRAVGQRVRLSFFAGIGCACACV